MDKGVIFAREQIQAAYDLSKKLEELNYLSRKIVKVLSRIKNTSKTGDLLNYVKGFRDDEHKDSDDFIIFDEYNIIILEKMYDYIVEHYPNEIDNYSYISDLKLGRNYSNYDIMNTFRCSEQGGMRRGKRTNSLVLVTSHTNPIYSDVWDSEEVLHYTGMGQVGDMDLFKGQNRNLLESNSNDIDIYLFEVFNDNNLHKYIYRGLVKLVGKPYKKIQQDRNKDNRITWIFPIKPLRKSLTNIDDIKEAEKTTDKKVRKLSNEDLLELLKLKKDKKLSEKVTISKTYHRDSSVKEYTKRRANGICELCGNEAPFKTKNGPYLEVHHVITLSDKGPDAITNTVALCPNCHRKIHLAATKEDRDLLVKIILNDLLDENELVDEVNTLFSK